MATTRNTARPRGILGAAATACALAIAACGSSGPPSGSTNAAASSDSALRFARCMRSSGVPNFPDPTGGGEIAIKPGSGLDPQSPAFQAAQRKCKRLLPGLRGAPHAPTRAEVQAALTFARCMRTHGVPDFPDPVTSAPSGRGPFLVLRGMMFAVSSGIDPRSPAFRQAAPKCGLRPLPGG